MGHQRQVPRRHRHFFSATKNHPRQQTLNKVAQGSLWNWRLSSFSSLSPAPSTMRRDARSPAKISRQSFRPALHIQFHNAAAGGSSLAPCLRAKWRKVGHALRPPPDPASPGRPLSRAGRARTHKVTQRLRDGDANNPRRRSSRPSPSTRAPARIPARCG